jgi:hypothetical protein
MVFNGKFAYSMRIELSIYMRFAHLPEMSSLYFSVQSLAVVLSCPEPSSIRALAVPRDKMTEAIMQAQSNPWQLEIGQLQVLVELLKQDDPRLLNTAIQCIIQATAFTINVVSCFTVINLL